MTSLMARATAALAALVGIASLCTSGASATDQAARAHHVVEHGRQVVALPAHRGGSLLSVSSRGAVFALEKLRNADASELAYVERGRSTMRTLLTTPRGWRIQHTDIAGHWAAYVATSDEFGPWRVGLVDTRTGRARIVASSDQIGAEPAIILTPHDLYYSYATDGRGYAGWLRDVDLQTGADTAVVHRDVIVQGVSGRHLFTSVDGPHNSTDIGELVGHRVVALTHDHHSLLLGVDGRRLLWWRGDDQLVVGDLRAHPVHVFHDPESGEPELGHRFILDIKNHRGYDEQQVRSLMTGRTRFLRDPRGTHDALFGAVHGNNVGWFADRRGDRREVLVLERIRVD